MLRNQGFPIWKLPDTDLRRVLAIFIGVAIPTYRLLEISSGWQVQPGVERIADFRHGESIPWRI
jgi:hypothetical protein